MRNKRLVNQTIVHDLKNGVEYVFVNTTAIEALVSAAMMEGKAASLVDEELRRQYRSRIVRGDRTISIGDLVVLLPRASNVSHKSFSADANRLSAVSSKGDSG